jgi:hypothetical protein
VVFYFIYSVPSSLPPELPKTLVAALNIIPGDLVRTAVSGVSITAAGSVSLDDPLCGFALDPVQAAARMSVVRSHGTARMFADLLSKLVFQATVRSQSVLDLQSVLAHAGASQ